MVWPFRSKQAAPPSRKSASFLLGMGSRGGLNSASFDRLALEGYAQNAVVNACVNKISSAIASVEPTLYKRKGGKLTKVDTHPLLDLLENPNPTQSGKEFVRYLVSYYLTGGNAYVWANGLDPMASKPQPPTELQIFNPGKVQIEPGDGLFPKWFEYKPATERFVFPVDRLTGRSAVMQFKTFNPLNPWYGLPPMLAAAYGIDIHNGGNLWNKKLLDNDGRPSGALRILGGDGKPANLTDDQYQRVKEMMDEQYSGANNAGRPLLLEGGLEWQQMSVNPKDMDFLNAKNSAARDIGLVVRRGLDCGTGTETQGEGRPHQRLDHHDHRREAARDGAGQPAQRHRRGPRSGRAGHIARHGRQHSGAGGQRELEPRARPAD